MSIDLVALIRARLPGVDVVRRQRPRPASTEHPAVAEVIALDVDVLLAVAAFLRDDPDAACDLVDLTAIDHWGDAHTNVDASASTSRFSLVVLLRSRVHRTRTRLTVALNDDDPAWPTLGPIWPVAHLLEREVVDMFGLSPDGHPNPRRLLMPDGFAGHPLRHDYRIDKVQPQVPPPEVQAPIVLPAVQPAVQPAVPPIVLPATSDDDDDDDGATRDQVAP